MADLFQTIEKLRERYLNGAPPERVGMLYESVPWLRRAVDLIAENVASFPVQVVRGDQEVEAPGYVSDFLADLRLYALDYLLYGRAWAMLDLTGPRGAWLVEHRPARALRYDENRAVWTYQDRFGAYYDLKIDGGKDRDALLWYTYDPDDGSPAGVGPAWAARHHAWTALETMLALGRYFEAGAINIPIFMKESSAPVTEAEQSRIRQAWQRLVGGRKKAYSPLTVSGVKDVKILNANPRDMALQEVLEEARRGIAVALGIPQTMLEDAANYATAREHRLQFYENTVKPLLLTFLSEFNAWLRELGEPYELIPVPQDLEVYQQDEATKAQSIVVLYNAGIITLEEAREVLGWAPQPETQQEQPAEEPQPQDTQEQQKNINPGGPEAGDAGTTNVRKTQPPLRVILDPAQQAGVLAELERWYRKAKKNPDAALEFESTVLPDVLKARVLYRLQAAGVDVEAAFWPYRNAQRLFALKAKRKIPQQVIRGKYKDEIEKEVAQAVYEVMQKYKPAFARALQRGEFPATQVEKFTAELGSVLRRELAPIAEEAIDAYSASLGVYMDQGEIAAMLRSWTQEYTTGIITRIGEHTADVLQQILEDVQSGDLSRDQAAAEIQSRLRAVVGEPRAQRIAVTEITRAINHSARVYEESMRRLGVDVVRYWVTAEDEKVCPICGPKYEKEIPNETDGMEPPAHPNCRCESYVARKDWRPNI